MPLELYVGVADLITAEADTTLVTLGLGSCVAIILHDPRVRAGGLAHILLPGPEFSRDRDNPAKFPCTAIPVLLEELRALGATQPRARIVGGASMFASMMDKGGVNIGDQNVAATRAALARHAIPIDGEDVGGGHGRSVYFCVQDGTVQVRSLKKGDRAL